MFYFFYYFPLGMDVRLRRPVWATWVLLVACVFGFLAAHRAPLLLWNHYENLVYVPAFPRLTALVLNAYLHGGWLHLISNMVSLVVFGPPLEDRLGARRFLLLYHICSLFGNLVQGAMALWWVPNTATYGILGASGAIAGLMGLFLVRLYFARLRVGYWTFMPLQAFTRVGAVNVPVVFAVVVWFLVQVGIAVTQTQGSAARVASGSHIGGLAAGVALGLILGLRRAAIAEQHLHRGRYYLDRAQWYPAQGEFIEYVRRQPEDSEGHLELARTYRLTQRHVQADHHYRLACQHLARQRRQDRVEDVHHEAGRGNPAFVLGAPQQLQLAQLLERGFKYDAAERAYLNYVTHYPHERAAPLALYRAGRLAMHQDAAWRAQSIYTRLLDKYPQSTEADLARDELRVTQVAA
ncbi:MAG: rhomboid family intramembrane serine protease [Candidatus Krumholzibacteriia bacterium]